MHASCVRDEDGEMEMRLRRLALGAAVALVALQCGHVDAQDYPNRPIRLVVTFPPGGSTDVMGRAIAPKLTELLGQPIVIDNRPGAGGNIGMDAVAKAPADGYTIGIGAAGALAVNISLYPKMPYDPVKDFEPITLFAVTPFIFVANPSGPAGSIADVIRIAKEKPNSLSIGHGGNGTAMHLTSALLVHLAGIQVTLVPYRGSAPVSADVMADHLPLGVSDLPASLALIKAGRLKALAVSGAKRTAFLPDVPTVVESGIREFDSVGWFGIVAPAGTPPAIVKRLHDAFVTAMKDPEVVARFEAAGADASPTTPEEFGAFIKEETAKWARVIKATGVKAD